MDQITIDALIKEAEEQQELDEILEFIPDNQHYLVLPCKGDIKHPEAPRTLIEIRNKKIIYKHYYKYYNDVGNELNDIQNVYHLELINKYHYEVYLMQAIYVIGENSDEGKD